MRNEIEKLIESIRKAKRVFLVGNGGSAANASHICNDLETCGVRAHVMNEATKSAWENDYEHESVFSRWISLHGDKGDLLIALSGSGKSPNILNAISTAEEIGMDIEKVFGAPALNMQEAEEYQVWLGHQLMRELKK